MAKRKSDQIMSVIKQFTDESRDLAICILTHNGT